MPTEYYNYDGIPARRNEMETPEIYVNGQWKRMEKWVWAMLHEFQPIDKDEFDVLMHQHGAPPPEQSDQSGTADDRLRDLTPLPPKGHESGG